MALKMFSPQNIKKWCEKRCILEVVEKDRHYLIRHRNKHGSMKFRHFFVYKTNGLDPNEQKCHLWYEIFYRLTFDRGISYHYYPIFVFSYTQSFWNWLSRLKHQDQTLYHFWHLSKYRKAVNYEPGGNPYGPVYRQFSKFYQNLVTNEVFFYNVPNQDWMHYH